MAEQLPDHVYGVIVELDGDHLILPNSAIVDVLSHDALRPRSAAQPWNLGEVELEHDHIPVVSLEALWGRAVPEFIRRSRIVIMKAPGRDDRVAVVARSYPLIVTLNEVAVQVDKSAKARDFVMSSVRVANRAAVIPDLDELVKQSHQAA